MDSHTVYVELLLLAQIAISNPVDPDEVQLRV